MTAEEMLRSGLVPPMAKPFRRSRKLTSIRKPAYWLMSLTVQVVPPSVDLRKCDGPKTLPTPNMVSWSST